MASTMSLTTTFAGQSVRAIPVRRQARRIVTAVKAEHQQAASRRAVAFAVPALAAAMLMMSAPVEAKIQGGKASSSTESSQSGYDMTGTKHRGLKPAQRKELLASAREEANKAVEAAKKVVK